MLHRPDLPPDQDPFLADLPLEWNALPWNEVEPWPQLASVARQFGLPCETGDEAERDKRSRRAVGEAVHATEVALRVWYVQQCTEHLLADAAGEPGGERGGEGGVNATTTLT